MVKSYKVNLLLGKLRSPLKLEYICHNIFEDNLDEALDTLYQLINDGVVVKNNDEYSLKKI